MRRSFGAAMGGFSNDDELMNSAQAIKEADGEESKEEVPYGFNPP